MTHTLNFRRITLSAVVIAFVASLVFAGTQAFFSDTESSTGNVFAAGALDLKVDSQAHFNDMICRETTDDDTEGTPGELEWHAGPGDPFNGDDDNVPAEHYPQPGDECTGTWEESDLIADALEFRFFNLEDIKPGDEGENTISLHVTNNDAWGCFLVDNVEDNDVDCTEPESESSEDPECSADPSNPGAGELGQSITFDAWLDHGEIPGFQCNHDGASPQEGASCDEDPFEGDNIYQPDFEGDLFWEDEVVDEVAEGPFALKDVLSAAYAEFDCASQGNPTGDTDYGVCHGLAEDGRMVGSATYYWGLAWNVPTDVGNEAQTDSLVSDMVFEAVQHRNNPEFECTFPEDDEPVVLGSDSATEAYEGSNTTDTFDFTQVRTGSDENDYFGWDPLTFTRSLNSDGDMIFEISAPAPLDDNPSNFDLVLDVDGDGTPDFLVYYHNDPNAKLPNANNWGSKTYSGGYGPESPVVPNVTTAVDGSQKNFTITVDSSELTGSEVRSAVQMFVSDEGFPESWSSESALIIMPDLTTNVFGPSTAGFYSDSI